MLTLGFIAQDTSSPQRKFYAAFATPDGGVTIFGDTNWATPMQWGLSKGTRRPTTGTVEERANKVRDLYREKVESGSYTVTVPLTVMELPDTPVGDLIAPFVEAHQSGQASLAAGNFPESIVATFVMHAQGAQGTSTPVTSPTPARVSERDARLVLPDGEVVKRPNGETYLPRSLGAHADVAVLRAAREHHIYALLSGPAGSGKTSLADATFNDLIVVQCHGDMNVSHLVGANMPTADGGWRWEDGPLTVAMKEGRALLLDEINKLPSEVSAVLHSAIDGRRVIRLDDRPDEPMVHAEREFYVIGTYNPDDYGSSGLSEAIVSRFPLPIEITTDYDAARTLGVPTRFVTIAENLNTKAVEARATGGLSAWVPQMRELLAAKRMVDAGLGEDFAVSAMVSQCPRPEDLGVVLDVARQVMGNGRIGTLTLGGQL